VVSVNNKGLIRNISATIRSVAANGDVSSPAFTSATLHMTVVMKNALWVPEVILQEDKDFPLNARGLQSTKHRF
jgi:hypothetical protein